MEQLYSFFTWYSQVDNFVLTYLIVLFSQGFLNFVYLFRNLIGTGPTRPIFRNFSIVSKKWFHYVPVLNLFILTLSLIIMISTYFTWWVIDAFRIITNTEYKGHEDYVDPEDKG